jgi:hypothetical protein
MDGPTAPVYIATNNDGIHKWLSIWSDLSSTLPDKEWCGKLMAGEDFSKTVRVLRWEKGDF